MIRNAATFDESIHSDNHESSTSSASMHESSTSSKGFDDVENRYFAKAESKYVRHLKILVLAVLFLVAIAVSSVVYFLTAKGQKTEFEASFEGSANKVISTFEHLLEQKIAAIAALGVTMTAYAASQNATWPFVAMNDFQERSASTRSLSQSLTIELLPIVKDEDRTAWEKFSVYNKDWLRDGREFQELNGIGEVWKRQLQVMNNDIFDDGPPTFTEGDNSMSKQIWTFDESWNGVVHPGPGPYFPIWQASPVLPFPIDKINFNAVDFETYRDDLIAVMETGQIGIGQILTAPPGRIGDPNVYTDFYAYIFSFEAGRPVQYTGEPLSSVQVPVMSSFRDDRETVAVLKAIIKWGVYFENILGVAEHPVHLVLENTCGSMFTYELRGPKVILLGQGNLADKKNQDMKVSGDFDRDGIVIEAHTIALTLNQDVCSYKVSVYPTDEADAHYNDHFPFTIAAIVGAVFIFTAVVFVFYDKMVETRQRLVLDTAQRSTAIVSSIFPKKVRDQLMKSPIQGNATKLRSFLSNVKIGRDASQNSGNTVEADQDVTNSGPIADLFPACTVMFADVEGFTSWSSVREPSQVFTLLENIYAAFDKVAAKRRVFKVETVGDCYVAVAGLPDPMKDHAVAMSFFAHECLSAHNRVVKELERLLGPGTGDLRVRIGLHSGPVTAGVLRGERSRFQLFGDTVNTASRLESSGEGGRIHISKETAELLAASGKGQWAVARPDKVHAKGKGDLQTFWLQTTEMKMRFSKGRPIPTEPEEEEGSNEIHSDTTDQPSEKTMRLVAWNVDVLVRLIKQIVASRTTTTTSSTPKWVAGSGVPLDEVVEVITLPGKSNGLLFGNSSRIELDPKIIELVQDYVVSLTRMYHDNPFHSFEHASHVAMSVAKLLSRIVAPSDMDFKDGEQATSSLHDHTYGITSDPLTQFSCILSALIHDVDHQGVTNATLIAEADPLVTRYGGKSLAEQNSVDKAWSLLMSDKYQSLVAVLCQNQDELARLRQLVVNGVMATDIMDPDLKKLRNDRWDKAFKNTVDGETDTQEAINRKATVVIEHLIQASDVAHTMQHWSMYTKWNALLFKELYKAYLDGRAGAKDPATFWARGEIGFFDFYIIPLAKKLKDCGVFGVSSDEYLNYALVNREEWERKGDAMVEQLVREAHAEFGKPCLEECGQ